MKDLIKDIIKSSRDRVKTPITGSFILAFVIYNWRSLLYLIFSDVTIEDKIEHVNETYCNIWALVGPLAIAIAHMIIVPYIMMVLEVLTNSAIEGRKSHKNKQKLFDLKIQKEIQFRKAEIQKIKFGKKEIDELNQRIEILDNELNKNSEQYTQQIESYNKLLEGFKYIEEENQTQILELSKNLKQQDDNLQKVLMYSGIKDAIESLSEYEKRYYVEFCQHEFFQFEENEINYDQLAIERFTNLYLIEIKSDKYKLTQFGRGIYRYIELYTLPF